VYRDFAARGNSHDLRRVTKAMFSPLTRVKLQRAVQVMLMEACDLSEEEAGFTVHHCALLSPLFASLLQSLTRASRALSGVWQVGNEYSSNARSNPI